MRAVDLCSACPIPHREATPFGTRDAHPDSCSVAAGSVRSLARSGPTPAPPPSVGSAHRAVDPATRARSKVGVEGRSEDGDLSLPQRRRRFVVLSGAIRSHRRRPPISGPNPSTATNPSESHDRSLCHQTPPRGRHAARPKRCTRPPPQPPTKRLEDPEQLGHPQAHMALERVMHNARPCPVDNFCGFSTPSETPSPVPCGSRRTLRGVTVRSSTSGPLGIPPRPLGPGFT